MIFCFLVTFLFVHKSLPQNSNSSDINLKYLTAFDKLSQILQLNGSFKEAVFIAESTYYFDTVFFKNEISEINLLSRFAKAFPKTIFGNQYHWSDSINHILNQSIFNIIYDTTYLSLDGGTTGHTPFRYSFNDPLGKQDWSNMFVTKLLATHQGNCHSLAYLYKILADEVGAKCWLSLAPNHLYIKNYSEKIGWYNTELTSVTFPTDAWVMVTGYVNPEAIKSGLYMDTLSNQQSIALCVLDLAKEYEFQTHNYYDGFILKCCDLVLQYHPVNPMALLLKAETLKKIYLKEREENYPKPTVTFNEMQNAYITLAKLGYREMPEKMYQQWLKEMTTEKEKYTNKKVTTPTTKK